MEHSLPPDDRTVSHPFPTVDDHVRIRRTDSHPDPDGRRLRFANDCNVLGSSGAHGNMKGFALLEVGIGRNPDNDIRADTQPSGPAQQGPQEIGNRIKIGNDPVTHCHCTIKSALRA
jgi:hypothetical protein